MEIIEKFNEALKFTVGEICWNAELTIGATLMLDLGKELTYEPPMVNPKTGSIVRIGEYNFLIFCSWRLENNNEVICTWNDKLYNLEILEQKVETLKGRYIEKIFLNKPSNDLIIVFDGNLILKVFCDIQTTEYQDKSNYYFSNFNELFAVKSRSQLLRKEQDIKRVFV